MEYPWKEVIITETPVFKSAKSIICESSENCMIDIIECIRNEPDVCMAEYFIHILWTRVNGEVYDENVIGPYLSPALHSLFKAFDKVGARWVQYNFNR